MSNSNEGPEVLFVERIGDYYAAPWGHGRANSLMHASTTRCASRASKGSTSLSHSASAGWGRSMRPSGTAAELVSRNRPDAIATRLAVEQYRQALVETIEQRRGSPGVLRFALLKSETEADGIKIGDILRRLGRSRIPLGE